MNYLPLIAVLSLTLGTVGSAQTYIWSPPNTQTLPGGKNYTSPFYAVSGTYQQIHEPESMGSATVLKGIAFRNQGTRTAWGRSWDMRLTLSHTSVTAQTATGTFATNLGINNTTIVFGSATTWPTFSFKDFTSTVQVPPPSFTIPFNNPYVYMPQLGSLCWEWRHKNNANISFMAMDASSTWAPNSQRGTVHSSTGTGCTATGNTLPATAKVTVPHVTGLGFQYQLDLTNAVASTTMVLAIGLTKNSQNIGWCSNLELNPQILLMSQTDMLGGWSIQVPLLSFAGILPTDIHTQFAFRDPGLPGGMGLTNLAGYKTPNVPGAHGVTRIYRDSGSNLGGELAITGWLFLGSGLVTGWLQ